MTGSNPECFGELYLASARECQRCAVSEKCAKVYTDRHPETKQAVGNSSTANPAADIAVGSKEIKSMTEAKPEVQTEAQTVTKPEAQTEAKAPIDRVSTKSFLRSTLAEGWHSKEALRVMLKERYPDRKGGTIQTVLRELKTAGKLESREEEDKTTTYHSN